MITATREPTADILLDVFAEAPTTHPQNVPNHETLQQNVYYAPVTILPTSKDVMSTGNYNVAKYPLQKVNFYTIILSLIQII